MKYLLVLTTAILSTLKVSSQSSFAKKGVKTISDSVFFNMLIFTVAFLIFSPSVFSATKTTWLFALFYAFCNVSFQTSYAKALSEGNVSVAVMMSGFGMIIPIIVSLFMFNEYPSITRIIGIFITLCAFVVMVKRDKKPSEEKGKKKNYYLVFAFLSALFNGLGLTVQKIFGKTGNSTNFSFVSATYLLCAILSLVVYLIFVCFGQKKTFTVKKHTVFSAIGAGSALAVHLAVNTYTSKVVDASFHFPANSGLTLMLSTLSGIFIFKDKLSKRQIIAFIMGLIAIILMNF